MTLKQIKPDLYKINKNQYLKINKKGEGRVIAPIFNPVKDNNGSNQKETINWFNFLTGGSWGKLRSTITIVLLILLFIFGMYDYSEQCRAIVEEHNKQIIDIEQIDMNTLWGEDGDGNRYNLPLPSQGIVEEVGE